MIAALMVGWWDFRDAMRSRVHALRTTSLRPYYEAYSFSLLDNLDTLPLSSLGGTPEGTVASGCGLLLVPESRRGSTIQGRDVSGGDR